MPWIPLKSGIRCVFTQIVLCTNDGGTRVAGTAKAAKNPGPLDFLGPMEIFSKEAVPELQEMAVEKVSPVVGLKKLLRELEHTNNTPLWNLYKRNIAKIHGWQLKYVFIFTSIWANDPIWLITIFHMGWNRQPVMVFKLCISSFNGMAVIVGYPGIRSVSGGKT